MKANLLKKGGFILALATVAVASFALAGCGDDHVHEFSDTWAYDATAHWHPTNCGHDAKKDKTNHVYVDTVVAATAYAPGYTMHTCACGYSYTDSETNPTGGTPVTDTEYQYDADRHWHVIFNGKEADVDYQPHDYTGGVSTVPAGCSSSGYRKHECKDCDYWYIDQVTPPTGTHTYDEAAWKSDRIYHWHGATCCESAVKPDSKAMHSYEQHVHAATHTENGYTEYECSVCGYSYRANFVPMGHTYATAWSGDENQHWHAATCEHTDEKADVANHVFLNGSNVCAVCAKSVTPRLTYELVGGQYVVTGFIGDLTAVEIPTEYNGADVVAIAKYAFRGTNIQSLTVPDGVALSNGMCEDCTALTTVTVSGTRGEIPASAFRGCTQLATLTIPSGYTKIGPFAFMGCAALNLPVIDSVQEIGFSAYNGTKLTSLSIPAGTVVDNYAFAHCAHLAGTVILPAGITLGEGVFKGSSVATVEVACVELPASAFEDCTSLSSVTLTGVKSLGDYAFKGCTSLSSLSLPATVEHVGVDAFVGSGLISSSGGVKYAANVAVGHEDGVTSVTIANGTVGIADGAFKDFVTLSSVTFADTSVKFIGVNAFRKCKGLSQITLPTSLTLISANAFRESGLVSITISENVAKVGENAFYDCEMLSSVSVDAIEIGKFAFSYTGVNRTLNSPVKVRPDYANLSSVTIGSHVQSIGSNAFQYCPITSVTLGSSVAHVGMYAFAQTDLTGITIPASVSDVGEYAFYGCASLSTVTFETTSGWQAGGSSVAVTNATTNAANLTTEYVDIAWTRS